MAEDGYLCIEAIVILLVLTVFAAGLGRGIFMVQQLYRHKVDKYLDISLLKDEVTEIIYQLENDPTPLSDSKFDPVWSYIEGRSDSFEYIDLTDLSSRINPNWVSSEIFVQTELKRVLVGGVSPERFRELRRSSGYLLDIKKGYSGMIKAEALKKFFTAYSYLNVNTSSEIVLTDLFAITGGESERDMFYDLLSEAREERRIISSREFMDRTGNKYMEFYPLIGTLPEMNIHFIPEFILEQILAYPYGGKIIENNDFIFNNLISIRDRDEISPGELKTLIVAKDLQERVFHHIGTKTWFWEISISSGKAGVKAIVVCIPWENGFSYRLYSFSSLF